MNLVGMDSEQIAGVYRAVKKQDEAVLSSEEMFGDGKSIEEIIAILNAKYGSATSDEERLLVGCAGNFAQINTLIKEGRHQTARTTLEGLAKNDEPFVLLNVALRKLGTDYARLCLESGKMLSPQQVDERVLERYAKKPSDEARHFLSKQGVAVSISHSGKNHRITLLFQQFADNASLLSPSQGVALPFRIGIEALSFSGPADKLEGYISDNFNKRSVDNFCIIRTTANGLVPYIIGRYSLMRTGAYLTEMTPIQGKMRYQFPP